MNKLLWNNSYAFFDLGCGRYECYFCGDVGEFDERQRREHCCDGVLRYVVNAESRRAHQLDFKAYEAEYERREDVLSKIIKGA